MRCHTWIREIIDGAPQAGRSATTRDPKGVIWMGGRNGTWACIGSRFILKMHCPRDSILGLIRPGNHMDSAGALWVSLVNSEVSSSNHGMWSRFGRSRSCPKFLALIETTDSVGRRMGSVYYTGESNCIARWCTRVFHVWLSDGVWISERLIFNL